MAQVDVSSKTQLGSGSQANNGIEFHGPNGNTASVYNGNSDFPAPPKSGTAVVVKIAQANGGPRFSNPS